MKDHDVDLREKRQVDAARKQVAKAKTRARPWRPIFLTALAVIMAAVSRSARIAAANEVLPETASGRWAIPGPRPWQIL